MSRVTAIFISLILYLFGFGQEPELIVRKAIEKLQGKSQYAHIKMQIIRPHWQKVVEFDIVTKGTDKALLRITYPPKQAGQGFLMKDQQVWTYNPKIKRVIKLGAGMLTSNWLGSDFSTGQLLDNGAMLSDYQYQLLGQDTVLNRKCWKILLKPKPSAKLLWSKIILWIDQKNFWILKEQYFDQDGYLATEVVARQIKNLGGRTIPTVYITWPADKPKQRTIMTIQKIKFDINVQDDFFSLENLRNIQNLKLNF